MQNQQEIMAYINENPLAVLSTVGKDNMPHGAAVFICALSADHLYFVTKTETQKFQNLQDNSHIAVTIANAEDNSCLQATGRANRVDDAATIELIMSKMVKIYASSADWLPPIAKLRAGAYQVVEITVKQARLANYKNFHPGDSQMFKHLRPR